MTMLREFFDITRDSEPLFRGLDIMKTEYAVYRNSRPVIYFSFKDCTGEDPEKLKRRLMDELLQQYARYYEVFEADGGLRENIYCSRFYQLMDKLRDGNAEYIDLGGAIEYLMTAVRVKFQKTVILLIDEYDQPILSSYENGYYEEMKDFFVTFYGTALKGNENLVEQALLTGIQRVAKERVFSKLNNLLVYTVLDSTYAPYFGLLEESIQLLNEYGLELTSDVKAMYDGYVFGGMELYNPWSMLTYVKKRNCVFTGSILPQIILCMHL